jgi:hypothetical protein
VKECPTNKTKLYIEAGNPYKLIEQQKRREKYLGRKMMLFFLVFLKYKGNVREPKEATKNLSRAKVSIVYPLR